jgi:hypothetical protein
MHFRPGDDPRSDPTEQETPVQWADNWLSNSLAWASYRITPKWCQIEEHFTSRVTQYLFTDCPCCLLFRGLLVGLITGILLTLVLLTIGVSVGMM